MVFAHSGGAVPESHRSSLLVDGAEAPHADTNIHSDAILEIFASRAKSAGKNFERKDIVIQTVVAASNTNSSSNQLAIAGAG